MTLTSLHPFDAAPATSTGLDSTENTVEDLQDQLIAAQRRCAHLEIALQSNRTIGMALGMIMTQHHLDETAAFQTLVRLSQETNTKMSALAERLISSHNATITTALPN